MSSRSRRARLSCESARSYTISGRGRRRRMTSMSRESGSPGENAPTRMAFRDSWHSALVYFGLAEEYHDDFEEGPPEAEIEDRYRERPNVRRLRRRRDEFDDIFAEDDRAETGRGGRSTTALKSVGGHGHGDVGG